MIGCLIAGATLLGLRRQVGNGSIKTVPFTFTARINPNSTLLGTDNTLFVADWPDIFAIDAHSGKCLWNTSLASHAALNWPTKDKKLGAFPIETGESIAFCLTYAKQDFTVETEIESRRRKDGALNFIVHVETPPVSPGRPFYYMTWPNVFAIGNRLLVVPDPAYNPQLFVLSASTGAVQFHVLPAKGIPGSVAKALDKASGTSFGACVYADGRLISLADSPYGPPTKVVRLGNRLLAQYVNENFIGAPSLSSTQGVALFPWSPSQNRTIGDIWRAKFMHTVPLQGNWSRFGPCVGQHRGRPAILYSDWKGANRLVEIDDNGTLIQSVSLDTFGMWKFTTGGNGFFLAYGDVSDDLYDTQGHQLFELGTKDEKGHEVNLDVTLLPCGVVYANCSRTGPSSRRTMFKFSGKICSVREK